MTKYRLFVLAFLAAAVAACGGSGSGPEPTAPPPATSTFTATLTDVVVVRSPDSLELDTGGVTVDGATVTITE